MVANTFDDGACTAVTNAEALCDDAVQKTLTAGGAVQNNVTGNDVLFRLEWRCLTVPRRRQETRQRQAIVAPDRPRLNRQVDAGVGPRHVIDTVRHHVVESPHRPG